MALLVRTVARSASSCLLRRPTGILTRRSYARPSAFEEMETFWAKNRTLNRPLSPHLTIYQPHLTMTISITNRITAVVLQAVLSLGGIYMLATSKKFPEVFANLKQSTLGYGAIILTKLVLAVTFGYHLVAGGRHLLWDGGMGFSKPMTINGSYAVLVLSAILCVALMVVKPSSGNKQ